MEETEDKQRVIMLDIVSAVVEKTGAHSSLSVEEESPELSP